MRGPGTFIEQMLLDGGRTFTRPLVRMALDDGMDYQRNFADPHKNSLTKWCDYYKVDYKDIFRERDNDEIFWSDSIQFVTSKRLQEWHDQHIAHDYSHGYCLKTNSSEGHCYGCKTCPTAEDIKRIIHRELSHIPVEEVIANLAGQRVRSVTRFIINKSMNWKIYSNETLCHYVASKFLQQDESLVKAFHKVCNSNAKWISDNDQKPWVGGYVVCDIEWKENISASELQQYVDKVNEQLHIAKVLSVYDIAQNMELTTKCNVSYISDWNNISLGKVTDRFNNFDWMVKVVDKDGQMPTVKKVYMPELKERILFVPNGSGVRCFMNLPITVNPHYVMSSIMGMPEPVCREYDFKCVDVGKESDLVCKTDKCGKYSNFSYILNKQLPQCPVCRGKLLLYKMSK